MSVVDPAKLMEAAKAQELQKQREKVEAERENSLQEEVNFVKIQLGGNATTC